MVKRLTLTTNLLGLRRSLLLYQLIYPIVFRYPEAEFESNNVEEDVYILEIHHYVPTQSCMSDQMGVKVNGNVNITDDFVNGMK